MFFKITQVASLYARVGILLTCGRHLHDHIIVLRPEVFWVHKTILTLLLFTEVHALSLESERSCICVSEVSISTILIFCFEIVPTVVFYCFSFYNRSTSASSWALLAIEDWINQEIKQISRRGLTI